MRSAIGVSERRERRVESRGEGGAACEEGEGEGGEGSSFRGEGEGETRDLH